MYINFFSQFQYLIFTNNFFCLIFQLFSHGRFRCRHHSGIFRCPAEYQISKDGKSFKFPYPHCDTCPDEPKLIKEKMEDDLSHPTRGTPNPAGSYLSPYIRINNMIFFIAGPGNPQMGIYERNLAPVDGKCLIIKLILIVYIFLNFCSLI